ncbi:MAG: hypothetical protein R6X06_04370 [Gammaproteobacteria bacterium]
MKLSETSVAALLMSILMVTLPDCDRNGLMEETGKNVDDTVEKTGAIIQDSTDGN